MARVGRLRPHLWTILPLALLLACGSHKPDLPELPEVDIDAFPEGIRGEFEAALQAARSEPDDPGVIGNLGKLLHAHEQIETAIPCYRRSAALDPDRFAWKYYLADALEKTGETVKAVEVNREALRLRPNYTPARLQLAKALLAINELDEARGIYASLIAEAPHLAAAHYGMGRVLTTQGKHPEALESYRRASELDPEAGAVHYAIALAYRRTGEEARAKEHMAVYQAGNNLVPGVMDPVMEEVWKLGRDENWYLNEGRRLEARGQIDAARRSYEEALSIAPDLPQAHVNLLGVYTHTQQNDKAEHHYQRALELTPGVAELHYNWGVYQTMRNRFPEAEQAFGKAIEINPQFADGHQNLGWVLGQQGRTAEALEHYREALKSAPNHRLAHYHLGRHAVASGRLNEAIAHLEQTLEPEDSRTPRFHYALADACARIGRTQDAIVHARKARDLAEKYGDKDLAEAIASDLKALIATAGR